MIIGPALPLDPAGHRSGRPDLLLRGPDRADGRPGYLPVEVKRHRVMEPLSGSGVPARVSTLERPLPAGPATFPSGP